MPHITRNPARVSGRGGVSEHVIAGRRDGSEDSTSENLKQPERRFCRPVSLHTASAWAIERLAHEYALSVTHAAIVADLAGIGGRQT